MEASNASKLNWFVFSEQGPSTDIDRIIDAMKIKTSFTIEENSISQDDDGLPESSTENFPMIIIYCTILGLVILTLFVYVIYKLLKQHLDSCDAKSASVTQRSDSLYNRTVKIDCSEIDDCLKANNTHNESTSHDMQIRSSSGQTKDNNYVLNDTSESQNKNSLVLRDFAADLKINSDWRKLGLVLGYSDDILNMFDRTARANQQSDNCVGDRQEESAYLMLVDFSSRNAFALNSLTDAISKMRCPEKNNSSTCPAYSSENTSLLNENMEQNLLQTNRGIR